MSSSSVSFRISRHTQDLAETVHALSQRLVTMEQRLEAVEVQLQTLRQQPRQAQEAEAASLAPIEANIERLLQDCRQLLAEQPSTSGEESSSQDPADGEAARPLHQALESEADALSATDGQGESSEDEHPAAGDLSEVHAA
jgi:DNA anti-recombination protein RmuC